TCEEELINMHQEESQAAEKLNAEEHFQHNETRKIRARLEIIRGVISNERVQKVVNLTIKEKEAKNVIQDLVNLAQSRFIKHL
ncbi:28944_t:CDS:2, partial [Gigaspora margarita]